MKVVQKIVFGIFLFFFGGLLLFNIYQFICIQMLDKPLATVNGYAILEVVSGSMEPTIHVGDLIVIDTKKKDIAQNDIVTFTDEEGAFVTHRVLSIKDNQMITKGDNNNSDDPAISVDHIVGTYVFKIGGLGILLSSLKSPFVMFMIFVVGMLICYFLSLDSNGNLIMSEEEKEYQEFLEYQNNQKKQTNSEKEKSHNSVLSKISSSIPKKITKETKPKNQPEKTIVQPSIANSKKKTKEVSKTTTKKTGSTSPKKATSSSTTKKTQKKTSTNKTANKESGKKKTQTNRKKTVKKK